MKKAELEECHKQYRKLMKDAREAQNAGAFRDAVRKAIAAWPHIDGMMQYERKFNNTELPTVEAIELVLNYAPTVFDRESLDQLETLLKDQRRIEKNTSENLSDKLGKARALMWDAHRLWDYLESHPDANEADIKKVFQGGHAIRRALLSQWEAMGLLRRASDGSSQRFSLTTRMGQIIPAKCSSCGAVTEGPKAMFLEPVACPECRARVNFVLLACVPSAQRG